METSVCLKVVKAGFVTCLLFLSVAQAQIEWGVTYSSTSICIPEGSIVQIHSMFRYPSSINEMATVVQKQLWFTKKTGGEPVDLQTEAEYAGRVKYHSDGNQNTLTITDLRASDSAEYKFRFTTNQPSGAVTGSPGVSLTVTALQVEVRRTYPVISPTLAELRCQSTCWVPGGDYIWCLSGNKFHIGRQETWGYFPPEASMSCAVRRYEKFPSPSVCIHSEDCNSVIYTLRSMCALRGSSVNVSCTYSSSVEVESTLWFSPQRAQHSQSEDLREDPQYAGRVEVLSPHGKGSTLRITELRESDSAEYRFKFRGSRGFKWDSVLPGTTLTVTAVQAQVFRVTAVRQSHTEAELRCHSSCSPASRPSYVWFKNGQTLPTQSDLMYSDSFYPGDVVSCAFRGLEDHRSPPVYPSKLPSLFWSPPGEIVEGSSVNLTCRLDGNSTATTTLSRGDHQVPLGPDGFHHFSSISSDDAGFYSCTTEEQHTVSLLVDVQYGPKSPSMSLSPPGGILEGGSVTLTCSSDANPAANYSWYKEGGDSPVGSGQNFTISPFRAKDIGGYYCAAQNSRGRHTSTLQLISVAAGSWLLPVALSVSAVFLVLFLVLFLLLLNLWLRRAKFEKQQSKAEEGPDDPGQGEELHYAAIQFATPCEDAIYSNFSPNWLRQLEEDQVIYSTPNCSRATKTSCEDVSALYGKVKARRE